MWKFGNVVKVSYVRLEERRDRRYSLPPLIVVIDDREWLTENWSLGGFLISKYEGKARSGHEVTGLVRVARDEPTFPFRAKVIRADENGLAVQFLTRGEALVAQLDRLISRRHGIARHS
jgi:hypothetical protein